jgi:hypothetical protein
MKKVFLILILVSINLTGCIQDESIPSVEVVEVDEAKLFKLGLLASVQSGEITWAEAYVLLANSGYSVACTPEQQAIFDALDSQLADLDAYYDSIGAPTSGQTTIADALSSVGLGCD